MGLWCRTVPRDAALLGFATFAVLSKGEEKSRRFENRIIAQYHECRRHLLSLSAFSSFKVYSIWGRFIQRFRYSLLRFSWRVPIPLYHAGSSYFASRCNLWEGLV